MYVPLRLARATIAAIERHAIESYPRECCGAVIVGHDGVERVRRITNIQDRLHAEDPIRHPRDARTAYFMDPKELYVMLREVDDGTAGLRVFYHSHPEHGAYFSDEDKARAMAWDEPAYPDACHLVVSVVGGVVADRLAVAWDGAQRDFVKIDLAVDG